MSVSSMSFHEIFKNLYPGSILTFSGASGALFASGITATSAEYPLFQSPFTDWTLTLNVVPFFMSFPLNLFIVILFAALYTTSVVPSEVMATSYPVTFIDFFQFTVNCSLPGIAITFSGISISGSGILLSMLFKNSTFAMSANLLLPVSVILIVIFFIAICPPKSIIIVPSFCIFVSIALLGAEVPFKLATFSGIASNFASAISNVEDIFTVVVSSTPKSLKYVTSISPFLIMFVLSFGASITIASVLSLLPSTFKVISTGFVCEIFCPFFGFNSTCSPSSLNIEDTSFPVEVISVPVTVSIFCSFSLSIFNGVDWIFFPLLKVAYDKSKMSILPSLFKSNLALYTFDSITSISLFSSSSSIMPFPVTSPKAITPYWVWLLPSRSFISWPLLNDIFVKPDIISIFCVYVI